MLKGKKLLTLCASLMALLGMMFMFAGCEQATEQAGGYQGIDVASPDWVGKLDAVKDAKQVLIVAGFSQDATDAWVALHEKITYNKFRKIE